MLLFMMINSQCEENQFSLPNLTIKSPCIFFFRQVPHVHHGVGHRGGAELRGRPQSPLQNSEDSRHDGMDQRGSNTLTRRLQY